MSAGLAMFTLFHVAVSLIGIASGFVVVWGMTKNRERNGWTGVFLSTTVLTSVTGFLFPFHRFLPSHALGILSLILLPIAIYALYVRRLAGAWNLTYSLTAVSALYLNVFVLIAQLFAKVPVLKAMAPTQSEAPFKVTQLGVLVLFITLGVLVVKSSRNRQRRTT
jgi:hypothetical protein